MPEHSDDRIRLALSRSTGFALDVNLQLPEGGVTVLFGASGCGKTTVLRCAAGLERASGFVRVAGRVWQDDARGLFVPTYQRRIGYVFQEASLFEHLNVRDNLRYGLKRIPDKDGSKRLDEAVELLGIGHLLQRRPAELSGGERQRCAIARSLAIKPSALFMDEPLAALDHARRLEIMPWIERLKRELRLPILYVTHSEEEVMRLADQLAVMQAGRLVDAGSVAETWLRLMQKRGGVGCSTLVIGRVSERDEPWGLMRVDCSGMHFWVRDTGCGLGGTVRLMVNAGDVSLSVGKPSQTSIQNVFACRVTAVKEGRDPTRRVVEVRAAEAVVMAELTARAAHELNLQPGMEVWAQVKTVAVHG